MLEIIYFVSGLLSVTFDLIRLCFIASYLTGQMLVSIFVLFVSKWLNILKQLALGFQILYEDFGYFINDVINKSLVLHDCILSTLETIIACYSNTKLLLGNVSNSISITANTLLSLAIWGLRTFCNFILLVKQALILIGLTIWTSIELIPLLIVYYTSFVLFYSGKLIWKICSIIKTLYGSVLYVFGTSIHFIEDVPLKAAAGIVLGFALMYLIRIYHKRIIRFCIIKVKKAFIRLCRLVRHILYELFIINLQRSFRLMNSWCRKLFIFTGRRINYHQDQLSHENSSMRNSYIDESLCVVCLDRRRNTILLPCRHLCVCRYCSYKVRSRNYQCPICREDIDETLSVYY